MRRLAVTSLWLMVGCGQGTSASWADAAPVEAEAAPVEPAPADVAPAPADVAPAPVDVAPAPVDVAPASVDVAPAPMMVASATVWRQSKTDAPPWSRVEIATVRFGVRPTVGETVTILPRHPTLPVLELEIRKVVRHGAPADGIPRWWEPVLERVTERAYLDVRAPKDRSAQLPVDVVVVYPATPSATLLDPKAVDPGDLPPGVLPKGVEIAVDVNGDGRPDAIESTVCTENPRRARCSEATAWEVHRRKGTGWQLVHRFEPAT